MELRNKVVIVTGASKGIGAAAARAFVAAGARVVLAARSVELLDKLSEELGADNVSVVRTDMTVVDDVGTLMRQAVDRFGGIDILVNNAGVGLIGNVATLAVRNLLGVIELNLLGPVYAIQAAVPFMQNSGGGLIINISSMITRLPVPVMGGYRASKMALDAISDSARIELAPRNIRVTTVYPATTATDFYTNQFYTNNGDRENADNRIWKMVQSAEHVAGKIVHAARTEPRVQYMNLPAHLIAFVGSMAPWLVESILMRMSPRLPQENVKTPLTAV